MTEQESFQLVYKAIQSIRNSRPVRVAINGIEGTGKTTFARQITTFLQQEGEHALHVSIDGFHFNKERRYRQGRDSALGYYEDSYDELGFVEKVLKSSQEKKPTITTSTHDLQTDEYLDIEPIEIPNDTILLTDGAYLFKGVYRPHWDLKIYLSTDFETAMKRGVARDAKLLGGIENAKLKYCQRYHAASRLYIEENNPEQVADIVIDNSDFNDLLLKKSNVD